MLVNGLWSCANHFSLMEKAIKAGLGSEAVVHVCASVSWWSTLTGITSCGQKVADEVQDVMLKHPSLETLSFVAHSMVRGSSATQITNFSFLHSLHCCLLHDCTCMHLIATAHCSLAAQGGLMARYAAGMLYAPSEGTLAGLKPACYVSLATPHLGVTLEDTHAQIGFVSGLSRVPVAGRLIKASLQAAGPTVAPLLFRRTGQEFLGLGERKLHSSASSSSSTPPPAASPSPAADGAAVLLQMAAPEGSFLQALKAFQFRAAYALVRGDTWVSWANGSIRHPSQLPPLPPASPARTGGQQQGPILQESVWQPQPPMPMPMPVTDPALELEHLQQPCEPAAAASPAVPASARGARCVHARLDYMLRHLQAMSWHQVDVQYGWRPFGSPHQAMQGRGWVNTQRCKPLADHVTALLRQQLAALEVQP